MRLHAGRTTIRGHVVDKDGAPVSTGLGCVRVDWAREEHGRKPRITYRSDSDGSFEITRLGRRPYQLRVLTTQGEGRASQAVRVDTTAGDVDGVTIVVDRLVRVPMRTTWPADETRRVVVLDAAGLVLERWNTRGGQSWQQALAPGEYVFVVEGQEKTVRAREGAAEVVLAAP